MLAAYRDADLFVLPSRIDDTGDRDGLPNVIIEAQSQALPVISTPISGIPELVVDGVNGRFVEPDDPPALAAAIGELAGDPALRARLGANGEERVRRDFDHRATIGALIELLAKSVGMPDAVSA